MRTQTYILLVIVLLICKSISAQKIPEWFFTQEPNCAAGISLPVTDTVSKKITKEIRKAIVKEYALLCAQLTNAIIGGNASFFGEVTRDNEGILNATGFIEMKLANLKDIEYIHYIGDSICLLYARFDTTYTDTMYINWEKKELNIHDYIYTSEAAMTSNENRFIEIRSAYIIDRMHLFCSLGLYDYMVYGSVLVDKTFKDLFTTEYLNVNNGACELLRKLLFLNPTSYISSRNGIDFGHSGFIPEITKLENATISSYGMYSCENYKLSVRYIPHGTSQFEIVIK